MKLSEEDKFRIIQLRKDGCTISYISKKFDVAESYVKNIIAKYYETRSFAVAHTKRKFSTDFKYNIVSLVLSGTTVNSLVIKYGLSAPTIHFWLRKYKELGYNGLEEVKIGRPKKNMEDKKNSNTNSTPLTDPEREELNKLRAEVEYLKMESEYLKKLNALVQKRQAQQQKKK